MCAQANAPVDLQCVADEIIPQCEAEFDAYLSAHTELDQCVQYECVVEKTARPTPPPSPAPTFVRPTRRPSTAAATTDAPTDAPTAAATEAPVVATRGGTRP